DDWGGHGSVYDGHALIALDVTQHYQPSANEELVFVRLILDGGFASQGSQGGPLKDHVDFVTSKGRIATDLVTNDNSAFSAATGAGLTVPAYVGKKTSTGDGTRFFIELGYTAAQVGA